MDKTGAVPTAVTLKSYLENDLGATHKTSQVIVVLSSEEATKSRCDISVRLAQACGQQLLSKQKRACLVDVGGYHSWIWYGLGQYNGTLRGKQTVDAVIGNMTHRRVSNVSALVFMSYQLDLLSGVFEYLQERAGVVIIDCCVETTSAETIALWKPDLILGVAQKTIGAKILAAHLDQIEQICSEETAVLNFLDATWATRKATQALQKHYIRKTTFPQTQKLLDTFHGAVEPGENRKSVKLDNSARRIAEILCSRVQKTETHKPVKPRKLARVGLIRLIKNNLEGWPLWCDPWDSWDLSTWLDQKLDSFEEGGWALQCFIQETGFNNLEELDHLIEMVNLVTEHGKPKLG